MAVSEHEPVRSEYRAGATALSIPAGTPRLIPQSTAIPRYLGLYYGRSYTIGSLSDRSRVCIKKLSLPMQLFRSGAEDLLVRTLRRDTRQPLTYLRTP